MPDAIDAFQTAWKGFSFDDRIAALDWIQAGAPEEDTAEGIAREWVDPS